MKSDKFWIINYKIAMSNICKGARVQGKIVKCRQYVILTMLMWAITVAGEIDFHKVQYFAVDSLKISADLYELDDPTAPFIILFHQAGWSRGEYLNIAPKLNSMGFSCLAVDLRSGGEINHVVNETHYRAEISGMPTTYIDALPDMAASVDYIRTNYLTTKIILWGSSYSAALVLKFTGDSDKKIDGVLAFSPGEYFQKFGKSDKFIRQSAKNISCPVFITSAQGEADNWRDIFESIPGQDKIAFIPTTPGNHGSRALWNKFPDHQQYWQEIIPFLNQFLTMDDHE